MQETEPRFQQRYALYIHLTVYIIVSMMLWFVYGLTANQWQLMRYPIIGILVGVSLFLSLPWPLLIMVVWGIVLIAHGLEDKVRRRTLVQRAVEREWISDSLYEKPKKDKRRRWTEQDHWSEKPKRQS
ncbi:MAG: 2TM domain-containing protein [Chloroflexota bacterium]